MTGPKISKIGNMFKQKIDMETDRYKKMSLEIHSAAEEQRQMKKENQLVFYFNEAVVQFGFLCLFSPCFTLAPLFSLCTNLLEITIKMDNMARYSRK